MRVVVVGAGFGGMEAMARLEARLRWRPDIPLTLVSDQNYLLFTPLLPQIVSCYIEPRHIIQTVRDVRRNRRFDFLREEVAAVDLAGKKLRFRAGGELHYDYLVLAPGSITEYFGVPGAAEHCFPLKSLEGAVQLRDRLVDLFEHADHEPDAQQRRRLLTLVVIGGGYTGVETIAELQNLIFGHVLKQYRGISAGDVRLLLVEASPAILAGVDPRLARRAMRKLQAQAITVLTSTPVTRCLPDAVELAGDRVEPAGLMIWTAGVRAHPMIQSLPGPHDRLGRAVVNSYLQLEGHPEVFVLGDNALVDGRAPAESPRVAPLAIAHGRAAAENILRLIVGGPEAALLPVDFRLQGYLVSLGMNDAVVDLMGFQFSGFLAWLFWNAVHLYRLVGVKKQIQVALDWTMASLFPRDTTILRRPVGCRLCDPAPSDRPPNASAH